MSREETDRPLSGRSRAKDPTDLRESGVGSLICLLNLPSYLPSFSRIAFVPWTDLGAERTERRSRRDLNDARRAAVRARDDLERPARVGDGGVRRRRRRRGGGGGALVVLAQARLELEQRRFELQSRCAAGGGARGAPPGASGRGGVVRGAAFRGGAERLGFQRSRLTSARARCDVAGWIRRAMRTDARRDGGERERNASSVVTVGPVYLLAHEARG